jgi:hypothetical protein
VLGQSPYIWEGSVLWPLKIKEECHGLPVCSVQGHGYLLVKEGLGSLFLLGKEVSSGLSRLKSGVTAYLLVASRVTATCFVKDGCEVSFYLGRKCPLASQD